MQERIEQFWTDDYKIFEQVYGKTSDKDLYGATLPPNIEFGSDTKATQASEKKERYLLNYQKDADDYDSYGFGDKYNMLLTHDALKQKKEKPSFNFISYNNFKPISQNSDPETYNYLKHLEEMEKEKISKYPKGLGGFKPYLNAVGPNPEETDAYKSIQDILDAHEANKGNDDNEDSRYLTYREKGKKEPVRNNESKPARNKNSKPRCLPGRCRKRSSTSYRVRTRPYVRRIKQRIVF
ncbi:Uncharacterized protein OBRU01_05878 [Operophtera brumata]|uniref:Uncharacterized protein n=1 Tax=Operophtera brumata TaxID=104452 RepID=A0A0L7LLX6_OPEBR|nr:Uncharacterized protein OBRU01_05878 [Operophtera brumata]